KKPVSLKIYNIKGQLVKTLLNNQIDPGNHISSWNGTDDYNKLISSGLYFYRLQTGKTDFSRKMILMK
nr:T9SS type A sorting domain-containing protein [Candidatus Cloacimonadota bacterium]